MLYDFRLGHNAMEATKNICCVKGEGAVDPNIVTRWLKKFCKNLDNQAKWGRPKTMTVLQAIETYSMSIWQFWHLTVQHYLSPSWPWQKNPELPNCASHYQNISKLLTHFTLPKYCKTFDSLHITKILQNFWLTSHYQNIAKPLTHFTLPKYCKTFDSLHITKILQNFWLTSHYQNIAKPLTHFILPKYCKTFYSP